MKGFFYDIYFLIYVNYEVVKLNNVILFRI